MGQRGDKLGNGYSGSAKKSRFSTRREAATGGAVGLLVGGSFGFFSIVSGPLQFIHIAQLLQRFHFSSVEDTGNSRTLKLYKYAKNARSGTIENTRLGRVEGRIAERFDTRLQEIGLGKEVGKSALTKF